MKTYLPLIALVFLGSCATTYRVPIEKAPPEWRDNGDPMGLEVVKGTTQTFSGEMEKGDVLLAFEIENERVATIRDALVWKGPYGTDQTIPAGSPAYARQFSLTRTRTYNYSPLGPSTNMNAQNNPIEWCVPRDESAVCIFWEQPDQARYISASSGVSLNARPSTTNGMIGPMPIIEEADTVDFSRKMIVKASITRLNQREARISTRVYAGDDWSPLGRSVRRVRWENGDEQTINLYGAKYKISPKYKDDKDVESVSVELVEAPEDAEFITMQEAVTMLNALLAAERAKAMNENVESEDQDSEDQSSEDQKASTEQTE